jgi:hypothetical protein
MLSAMLLLVQVFFIVSINAYDLEDPVADHTTEAIEADERGGT